MPPSIYGTSDPKAQDDEMKLLKKIVETLFDMGTDADGVTLFPEGNAVQGNDRQKVVLQKLLGVLRGGIEAKSFDNTISTPIEHIASELEVEGGEIDMNVNRIHRVDMDNDLTLNAVYGKAGYSGLIIINASTGDGYELISVTGHSGDNDINLLSNLSTAMAINETMLIHISFSKDDTPTFYVVAQTAANQF